MRALDVKSGTPPVRRRHIDRQRSSLAALAFAALHVASSSCILPLPPVCFSLYSRWRGTGAVLVVAPLSGAHVLFCFSLLSSAALCPWTWARHCHRHLAHITRATHSLVPMPCFDPPRSVPLARASARQRWDGPHTFAHFHVCLRSGDVQSCIVGLQVERDVSKRTTFPEERRKGR